MTTRMHEDQWHVDSALAGRLVADQFPQWSDLEVTPVPSAGTVNALFRLGDTLVVRLPLTPGYATDDHEAEARWLAWVAPQVTVAVPEYAGIGRAGEAFPASWSICRWLPGEPAEPGEVGDLDALTAALVTFVAEVRALDPAGWTLSPGRRPLRESDSFVGDSLARLTDEPDHARLAAAWEYALTLPDHDGPPVPIHGDLIPGNLLLVEGALSAVIDWTATASDPAHDLICSWYLLDETRREAFRLGLQVDEATWRRGWARALEKGLTALPYYRDSNPGMARHARHVLHEVVAHQPR